MKEKPLGNKVNKCLLYQLFPINVREDRIWKYPEKFAQTFDKIFCSVSFIHQEVYFTGEQLLLWFFHRKRIKLSRFCCVRISLKSAPDILYTSASSLYSSHHHHNHTIIISLDQNKLFVSESFWPFWPFSGMVANGRQGFPGSKGDPRDGWDELEPNRSYLSHFPTR